jgi:hypothetical protein
MQSILSEICRNLYNNTRIGNNGTKLTLTLDVEFEGFYGRASEDMEYQFTLNINNIKYKSNRFESFDDFIKRIYLTENIINKR